MPKRKNATHFEVPKSAAGNVNPTMVVQLIAKDKNEKLQYEGRSKLMLDSISKLLLVEPVNEEYKMISAMFKWEFVAQKNILFVFAEHDFQDFALVFDDSNKCKKIYGILLKKGALPGNNELICQRFLPHLFQQISRNDESTDKMKEVFVKWIARHGGKEKEEYIQLLKKNNIYNLIFSNENQGINRNLKATSINYLKGNDQNSSKRPIATKRKLRECSSNKIIAEPLFEILKYVKNGISKTKIFIFTSLDKKYCYEFSWNNSRNIFCCLGCGCGGRKKLVTAKNFQKNGKRFVKLSEAEHICQVREYTRIIEKPNFEVIYYENNLQVMINRLIIFLDASRSLCYEYLWKNQQNGYICSGCIYQSRSKVAKIYQKEDGTEFVMFITGQHHVCKPRKFNPEKYAEKKTVAASNFEIYDNETKRSRMVIFASNDKKTCYEYYWSNCGKHFYCTECRKKGRSIFANLLSNADGTNYLKLSRRKHICEPCAYDPHKFEMKNEIIESSEFKILHYDRRGISTTSLIIFCSTNKNLCHEYYWNSQSQYYICRYCPMTEMVRATAHQRKDGESYLILSKSKHICELREFVPEKFKDDVIIDKSMYKISSTILRRGAEQKSLIIFTSKEKMFYYKFEYQTEKKYLCCRKCLNENVNITVAVKNEGQDNECVYVPSQKHVCEPFEYTSLVDNNIILAPNYQLVKRKIFGKISERLVVFTNEDKNECYEYSWSKKQKYFICFACGRCRPKAYVYAKLLKKNKNEEYVELSKTAHICQPIKFIPEDLTSGVIKMPDFKLFEEENKKKLIIYDSKNRKLCYIYIYRPNTKNYVCHKCCIQKKKHVTAKLCQDENGQNYLELNNTEHVCEPSEFTPVVEVPLTETQTQNFQLVKRKVNGNIIQRMVVFTNEEKSECYEYSWRKNNKYFLCQQCRKLHNFNVYAKLIKNDENEECVQLCKKAHKCQPIKFLPENITPKIVKQLNFKLWEDSSKKKRLTIYDNKNPKLGYMYVYRQRTDKYICTKCCSQKKSDVTAKLCNDENGETFVELSNAEHICKMVKL